MELFEFWHVNSHNIMVFYTADMYNTSTWGQSVPYVPKICPVSYEQMVSGSRNFELTKFAKRKYVYSMLRDLTTKLTIYPKWHLKRAEWVIAVLNLLVAKTSTFLMTLIVLKILGFSLDFPKNSWYREFWDLDHQYISIVTLINSFFLSITRIFQLSNICSSVANFL